MARITGVIAVPAAGAYYVEDLAALQARPTPLPDRYTAEPVTPGFRRVREPAEAVSVGLVLDGARVAWGDCAGVAYGGKAGRDPVFRASEGLALIRQVVAPALEGREIGAFRPLAAEVDALVEQARLSDLPGGEALTRREVIASPLASVLRSLREGLESGLAALEESAAPRQHAAVRYGVGQALLAAAALAQGVTMAEVIAAEWGLPLPDTPVAVHAQSGAERVHNADKMIARRVASLPHALVDDIPAQLGQRGEKLVRYVRWLAARIRQLGGEEYRPAIHLDVHGALGAITNNEPGRILGQLYALEQAARPCPLRVESPAIMETRAQQIALLKTLREYIRARRMKVRIVVDEWANTLDDIRTFVDAQAADMVQVKMPDLGGVHNSVEAVLACRAGGVEALLGGSCAETDLSARVSAHVALATRPEIVMARPGMGVDEGISIVQNEMGRALAWIAARRK